jgi:PIN domain nuclease of toxin-antitoxin system
VSAERFLLDTNVVVWLLLGDRARIPGRVAEQLEDERNEVKLSAVSVWEIAIKRSLGRLRIADGWASALRSLDFEPLPVTALHAEAVETLPWHHRDPFDRLLIAQASVERSALVTSDGRFTSYGVPTLW